jgi:undecaprenyl diphosphate synthase
MIIPKHIAFIMDGNGRWAQARGLPDVDLLIRSGGEKRISNFMLWQIATAYIYFTDTFWPDIGRREIHDAFKSYNEGIRR